MIRPPARSRKPPAAADALLAWYDAHRRALPWRAAAGAHADPYAVWLSEIMLQQTTVAAVENYYRAFLARWPTVEALAAAPREAVLAEWAGLGYYARARNLHTCAQRIAQDYGGRFPRDEAALLSLPGVGPYTAAAMAAIAFDAPAVPVDGNVERVIARLHAIETPPQRAKKLFREKAQALAPGARHGDFAQALMDLGATICTPRAPKCGSCPLAPRCAAHNAGATDRYPVRASKAERPRRRGAIFILLRGDAVLLTRRPATGLFGAMLAFPSTPLGDDIAPEDMLNHAPAPARWRALEPVAHVFTHFSLEATVFVATVAQAARRRTGAECWTKIATLAGAGLPGLMRKAAARAGLVEDARRKRAGAGAAPVK